MYELTWARSELQELDRRAELLGKVEPSRIYYWYAFPGMMRVSKVLISFFLGFFISLIVFVAVTKIFPPPGLGEGTLGHDEDTLVLPSAYRQDIPTQGQYSRAIDGEVPISSSDDYVPTNYSEKKVH